MADLTSGWKEFENIQEDNSFFPDDMQYSMKNYRKNEVLFHKGDSCDALYVVMSGSVKENFRLYAGIYGLSNNEIVQKTQDMLFELDMLSAKDTLVKELPLGWKQKLSFSLAIVHKPQIVFLDEPTGC